MSEFEQMFSTNYSMYVPDSRVYPDIAFNFSLPMDVDVKLNVSFGNFSYSEFYESVFILYIVYLYV